MTMRPRSSAMRSTTRRRTAAAWMRPTIYATGSARIWRRIWARASRPTCSATRSISSTGSRSRTLSSEIVEEASMTPREGETLATTRAVVGAPVDPAGPAGYRLGCLVVLVMIGLDAIVCLRDGGSADLRACAAGIRGGAGMTGKGSPSRDARRRLGGLTAAQSRGLVEEIALEDRGGELPA